MKSLRSIHRFNLFEVLLVLLGSGIVLFVVAPLLGMLVTTSWSDLSQAAVDRQVRQSIRVTLWAALLATVGASITGIPLGYLLARRRFWGRSFLMAVVDVPVIIPHSAAGIALLTAFGRQSWLGTSLTGTMLGIALAMAFVSLPFLVNAAHQAFAAVPVRLEKVAQTLGAGPARIFFTISLPLAWRGLVSGMVMMWARGISEFGAVVIIAYHPMTTPVMVFQRFNDFGLDAARSVAVLLILICVGIFALLRLLTQAHRD